jgi:hypothetical protein
VSMSLAPGAPSREIAQALQTGQRESRLSGLADFRNLRPSNSQRLYRPRTYRRLRIRMQAIRGCFRRASIEDASGGQQNVLDIRDSRGIEISGFFTHCVGIGRIRREASVGQPSRARGSHFRA